MLREKLTNVDAFAISLSARKSKARRLPKRTRYFPDGAELKDMLSSTVREQRHAVNARG